MARRRARFVITAQDLSRTAFRSVRQSLAIITRAVFSFQASIGALVGAGGLGLLVSQSLRTVDALGKVSARLGVGVRALSEYRLAADLAGLRFETFTMALQRMTRRVSEAAQGQGEAQEALRELRLEAEAMAALPIEQQFEVIANALSNVESEADRLRLAFRLFDSEGTAVLQMMRDGAQGLADMRVEAQQLGLSLSDNAVAGVEAANDALARLRGLFIGLRDQVVSSLAPAIATLTNAFKDFILQQAEAEGGIERFARNIAIDLLTAIRDIGTALFSFAQGAQKAFNVITQSWQALPFVRGVSDVLTEIEMVEAQIRRVENAISMAIEPFPEMGDELNRLQIQLMGLRAELDAMNPLITGNSAALDTFVETMDRMIAAADAGGGVLRERLTPAVKSTGEQIEDTGQELNDMTDQMTRSIEDWGGQFTRTLLTADRDFKGFVASVIQQIITLVAQQALIRPIATSIGTAIGGPLGGFLGNIGGSLLGMFGGGGGGSGVAGFAAGPMGGGFGGLFPGGQHGGTFEIPGQGGIDSQLLGVRVTPGREVVEVRNKADMRAGEPEAMVVNFNITTADARDFDRLLLERRPLIVGMMREARARNFESGS